MARVRKRVTVLSYASDEVTQLKLAVRGGIALVDGIGIYPEIVHTNEDGDVLIRLSVFLRGDTEPTSQFELEDYIPSDCIWRPEFAIDTQDIHSALQSNDFSVSAIATEIIAQTARVTIVSNKRKRQVEFQLSFPGYPGFQTQAVRPFQAVEAFIAIR